MTVPDGKNPPEHPKRRPRWPWLLLGTGLAVGGLVAYSPTLLGRIALNHFGAGAGLSGGRVSGPLWSPKISDVALNMPGLKASAGQVGVAVNSVDVKGKTAHITVSAHNVDVALDLKKLVGGEQKGQSGGGGAGWKIVVDGVDVQDSRLTVDGKGLNVPNLSARIDRKPDGTVLLHGRTPDGPLSAQVIVGETAAHTNKFTLNLDADARIIRHYWKGVQSGRIKGKYVFGDGPVRGDLRVINATLRVPEAKFVTVTGVNGLMMHRDTDITLKLAGRGWNGPVVATGGVDLKAKHWTVTADATPTISGLARSLGTTGEGDLKLRVTAGGWSTIRVKAYAQGAGKLAGVPFRDANAEYTYLNHEGAGGTGQTNDLALSAKTALAGQQLLKGQWAFGRAGTVGWKGDFAGRALDVTADIDAHNTLSLLGQALGGPLKGTLSLHGLKMDAVLNPDYGAARARVALKGTPQDLNAVISGGQAGPFPLAGTAHFGSGSGPDSGLKADLGALKLNLDHQLRGKWQAQNLTGSGLSLSGAGTLDLPGGDVLGQLRASVPGLAQPLSGPLALNYVQRRGTFQAGAQRLTWTSQGNANQITVQANGLALAGGAQATGRLRLGAGQSGLQAFGNLNVSGNGYDLTTTAQGQAAQIQGKVRGARLLARSQLQAPFRTEFWLPEGNAVSGTILVQNGVRFSLNTGGQVASGVINGPRWDATGRVNLAALRPFVPVRDLSGTLDLNLAGLGGGANVRARAAGATVAGTLTRVAGNTGDTVGHLLANLHTTLPSVGGKTPTAALSGQIYPAVQASGGLNYAGQRLKVSLSGPYHALTAAVNGRTAPLTFGGVSVPGQAVALSGTLTPKLGLSGRWGDLNLAYDGKQAHLSGVQTLSAGGQRGQLSGEASWEPGFTGSSDLRLTLGEYTAAAQGPWNALNLNLSGAGLRASGTASLPDQTYDLGVNSPVHLGAETLSLSGRIRGKGARPSGQVQVRDQAGGLATVQLAGLDNLALNAAGLHIAGQTLRGQLRAEGGLLSGQMQAGPLNVRAVRGQVQASGVVAGQSLSASGRVVLPGAGSALAVSGLNVQASGPYLSASASGDLNALTGTVKVRRQVYGPQGAQFLIPAQTLPLSAAILGGPRVQVGGLSYQGGNWGGNVPLNYALLSTANRQSGVLRVTGEANRLSALASGPLSGRVQVLPRLDGQITTSAAPLLANLPAQLRAQIAPGQLVARLSPTAATLSLTHTRYLNEPLGLDAQVDWKNGVQASALLTHPGTRLPISYAGGTLNITAGTLDAHALRPILPGATGDIQVSLNVPDMKFDRAQGQARVNIRASQNQSARGTVTLANGQLSGDLSSDLGGQVVAVRGDLYPRADATYSYSQGSAHISGTLQGNAAQTLNLSAKGQVQGKAVDVRGQALHLLGAAPTIRIQGQAAGAVLDAALQRRAGAGLDAWKPTGTVKVADLKTVAGTEGHLNAVLGGTLAQLRVLAQGEAAGVQFKAPVTYQGGALRLAGGVATLSQGQVSASGTVFPKLALSAKAALKDGLPGQYTAQITGPVARPVIAAQGHLNSDHSAVAAQVRLLDGGAVGLRFSGLASHVAGTLTPKQGQWAGTLAGVTSGHSFKVGGDLYPRTHAQVQVDTLGGDVVGELANTLTLNARGKYAGHPVNLQATASKLTSAAGRVALTGTVENAQLDLAVQHGTGAGLAAWKASGTASVPDLRPLAKVDGQVTAALGGTLQALNLTATGTAAGIQFSAPLTYQEGKVEAKNAHATLKQGEITASGTVFPKLALSGQATLSDLLPGQYTAQVSGSYSKPLVTLSGLVTGRVQGLDAAGTHLDAKLLGKDWKADLSGPRLAGTARGQLGQNSAGGLQALALNLATTYQTATTPDSTKKISLTLRGPLGWTVAGGWTGLVRASGQLSGEALDATLKGSGPLTATAQLGKDSTQTNLSATFPASLPLRPGGTVTLRAFDVGALWQRPGEVRASGTAALGGATWNKLRATFAGDLSDTQAELSGHLNATYDAGNIQATMRGDQLQAQASLRGGRYDLQARANTLHLARLLPPSLGVNALTFAGNVQARGSLSSGPELLNLQNVALRGEQKQAGPFSLNGSALYQPDQKTLQAYLRGSLRGGTFAAIGSLPDGLNIALNDIPTNYPEAASFGVGKLSGGLRLTGEASNPLLSGQIRALTDQLDAQVTLSGRGRDPHAHAQVKLLAGKQKSSPSGLIYADVQDVNLAQHTARGKVYGTVTQGGTQGDTHANIDLAGVWPNLAGQVRAQVAGLARPVTLVGDGQGSYTFSGQQLGGGTVQLLPSEDWLPKLSGDLKLSPLAAVQGSSGQAEVTALLSGTLAKPQVSGSISTRAAGAAGVTLQDTSGTFSVNDGELAGTLTQAGQTVATLRGQDITLSGLGVQAAGSTIQASGTAALNGTANLALTAMGNVEGNLKAAYKQGDLSASGTVSAQGLNGLLDIKASQKAGWAGQATVSGGPAGILTEKAVLKLSGPFAHPLLSGQAGVLGAGARVVASAQGVQIRLVDGPEATATGAIEMRPNTANEWVWSGATSLTRPELSLSVTPTGPLSDPLLTLSVRRGQWQAGGLASRHQADLNVTDGVHNGSLTWDGKQGRANLPGLDLSRLQITGLSGTLSAQGQVAANGKDGQATLNIANFAAPNELPLLGIKPAGDLQSTLKLVGGKAQIQAGVTLNDTTLNKPLGTLNLRASQTDVNNKTLWTGAVTGALTKDAGRVDVNLRADSSGVHGDLQASDLTLSAAGQHVTVGGKATFAGQTFKADFRTPSGSAIISADGGLADALPALKNTLALTPTGDGYSAHAVLSDIDVSHLKVAPGLGGQVSGEANFNDGGGTFLLKSDALQLGPKTLPTRLEGTLIGGAWRLRGALGESDFTAGLNAGGEVYGSGNLRALPLGAMVAAVTGTSPGEGVVTGIARFRFPVADPPAGSATIVAERIRVSTTPEASTSPANNTASSPANSTKASPEAATATSATEKTASDTAPPNGATPPLPAGTTPPPAAPNYTETLMGSGSLDFANRELRNINVQLAGAGTWDVQGQYTRQKVDLNAKFTDTTFTPVLRLIPGLTTAEPALKGTLTLSAAGTYDKPRGLLRAQNLTGSVAGLSLQIPEFAGDLPDSGAFTAGGRILTGGSLGSDGQLDISGQLTLGKLSQTGLKFTGMLAPEFLGALPNTTATLSQVGEAWQLDALSQTVMPASGTTAAQTGSLTLKGNLTPRWDLALSAQNYNLPLSVIYGKESALNGDLRLLDDGQLIHVTGQTDFARLILGRVNAPKTIPAPGESTVSSADTPKSSTSNFVSPLPEQYTTFPKKPAPADAKASISPTITTTTTLTEAAKPTLPLLERMSLENVQIHASGGIRIDENLARADFGTSGLTVSGTAARPKIAGTLDSQRGSLFLRENEFALTEGHINFAGESLYPTFHLVAQGNVRWSRPNGNGQSMQNVPIVLTIDGDFRTVNGQPNVLHLDTKLTCSATGGEQCINPDTGSPFGEAELYALVATGVPDLGNTTLSGLGASALQTALNVFVLGEVERTLAKALGVDILRFTPTLSDTGALNATFTVGSYLTRELFFQYQVDLSGKGLIGAKYTTPDNKFTFEVNTPLNGLDLQSVRPSFSAGYNVNRNASVTVGVESKPNTGSTLYKFGVTYRILPK